MKTKKSIDKNGREIKIWNLDSFVDKAIYSIGWLFIIGYFSLLFIGFISISLRDSKII